MGIVDDYRFDHEEVVSSICLDGSLWAKFCSNGVDCVDTYNGCSFAKPAIILDVVCLVFSNFGHPDRKDINLRNL